MGTWTIMGDVVLTLAAAVTLGAIFQFLGQSRIVGYLLAGLLIGGPGSFHLVKHVSTLQGIAEIGVTLLLFTIGLDFSWQKLRQFGMKAAAGGSLQVLLTLLLTALVMRAAGFSAPVSIAVGMIVSLSSTAVVLRILADRSESDSTHGFAAIGLLLIQDIALVPFLLLMPDLGHKHGVITIVASVAISMLKVAALAAAMYIIDVVIVARAFFTAARGTERQELLTIMSLLVAMAAAWTTHEMGLSAALGAFIAGALVGNAPYADHVRAEISSVRVIFTTLFLASIGMMADINFLTNNIGMVVGLALAVMAGKTVVSAFSLLVARSTNRAAILAGVGVSQLGEFSFVLAVSAREADLLTTNQFQMLVSLSLVTILLTPYAISGSAPLYALFTGRKRTDDRDGTEDYLRDHVVVIGYGPAGERACERIRADGTTIVVVELNPSSCDRAVANGLHTIHGDATRASILDKACVDTARLVVISLPETRQTTTIIRRLRTRKSDLPIVARGRYHRHIAELLSAGATVTSDEEVESGEQLAQLATLETGGA